MISGFCRCKETDMKTRRALAILLLLVLTTLLVLVGCEPYSSQAPLATPAGTDTPDPVMLLVQAGSSQSTAQAAVATAGYYSNQLTATVQQHEWDGTATWSSINQTATQQSSYSTATAASDQATSTAAAQIAATGTAGAVTQIALNATSTVMFADARTYATAAAGQAEGVQMGVERERMTNQVKAIAPWVITILGFFMVLVAAWLRYRVRIIHTGQPGDKPLLLDLVDGTATDLDLSVHPQTGTRRQDRKALLPPPVDIQVQIKARDQVVDLATRGMTSPASSAQNQNRRRAGAKMLNNTNQLPTQTRIQILPAERAAALVGDVIPAIVRDVTGMDINDTEEK